MKIVIALKRASVELSLFVIVALLLFVFPVELSNQGLQLLLYKVLLFSGSQLHAMVMRKWFFPYVDFRNPRAAHGALVVALHIAAAYVYAQGG